MPKIQYQPDKEDDEDAESSDVAGDDNLMLGDGDDFLSEESNQNQNITGQADQETT